MKISEEGIRKRVTWETESEEDISRAREIFTRLTRQGWLATKECEKEYRRVLEFKPEYGELLFIPLSEGG